MMSRVSVFVVVLACLSAGVPVSRGSTRDCRPQGALTRVPDLPEASGLALSRRTPGQLWAHNDSGEPIVIALDGKGRVAGRVRISGASVEDWEALAVGPCSGGSCLYIADIGDNDGRRPRVTIYRVPEPAPTDSAAEVDAAFHVTYPDGSHDAEALLMTPAGDMFIVTKGDTGPIAVYRVPRNIRAGGTAPLERVGQPFTPAKAVRDFRITDGAVSPDGEWVALRTKADLVFYRASELLKGTWREAQRVSLAPLGEPQGEGIALGAAAAVYLAGEGGGKGRPGTFIQFACAAVQPAQ